jgi:cytochrome c553
VSRAALLALGWFCATVSATVPALAYDAEAGQRKAEEACAPCHGKAGVSEFPTVPSLAGQGNDYVVLALFQFRNGHRPSETMAQFAKPLSDNDLGNLAAYYSALKPWPPARQTSPEAAAAALGLALQKNCVQCHNGPGLQGQQSVPRIAGQQIDFVTAQLKLFKAGVRGDIDGNMTSAAQELTDADIATLADYISGLSTP